MRISLACSLLATLLAVSPVAVAQTDDDALTELRQLAEDSFADDDLEAAVALYRQLADRTRERQEKSIAMMDVAYVEHLLKRHGAAVATVTDILVEDPGYAFQADLYNESMRDIFYQGQKAAAERREELALGFVRKGLERLRGRDYDAARGQLEAALTYLPGHPGAIYHLALTDLHDQREESAEAGFQKLLALGTPVSAELRVSAMINLGYLYQRRRLYGEAEEILEQAVALDPASSDAWSNLGAARRQMGQTVDAAEAFRRAYELSPDHAETMSHLALAYIDAKDWPQAVALLEKATTTDASRANLWLQLGKARLGVGRSDDAITAFETAIRLDPANSEGWAANAALQLAEHYYATRQYSSTLQRADQVIALGGDTVTARIFQGLARQYLGDLSGAKESLEEARRLDPTRAGTHNSLGSVYYKLGMLDEATAAFEQSLAIRPDSPEAKRNLEAVREARSRPRQTSGAGPVRPTRTARLGIRFADIDYAALGLKGAMVERVEVGGAAGRAGLEKNDLILKVDGRDVVSVDQLNSYVASRPRGSRVTLSLLRANIPQRIDVRLD